MDPFNQDHYHSADQPDRNQISHPSNIQSTSSQHRRPHNREYSYKDPNQTSRRQSYHSNSSQPLYFSSPHHHTPYSSHHSSYKQNLSAYRHQSPPQRQHPTEQDQGSPSMQNDSSKMPKQLEVITQRAKNAKETKKINILSVGCTHGKLDLLYESAREYDQLHPDNPIDFILCPGDFQAVRDNNGVDMASLVSKVGKMEDFHKYYKGESKASHLTIFVGGNHESSQYLFELENGGFVAPNIYYIGRAGVISVMGVRILGFGGIYNKHHAEWGIFEQPPWNEDNKRSIYHQRTWDIARCRSLKGPTEAPPAPIDVILSHDWPRVATGGGKFRHSVEVDDEILDDLWKRRPFFRQEIDQYRFSSPLLDELYIHFNPVLWCAAHFHTWYEQKVKLKSHPAGTHIDVASIPTTQFVALDKPGNREGFNRLISLIIDSSLHHEGIKLDVEWMHVANTWWNKGRPSNRGPLEGPLYPELPKSPKELDNCFTKILSVIKNSRPGLISSDLYLSNPTNSDFPRYSIEFRSLMNQIETMDFCEDEDCSLDLESSSVEGDIPLEFSD